MLSILQRGHQVRDTAETETHAKNSSPATIPTSQPPNALFHGRKKTPTYCVVPPLTNSTLVISRFPQTGQSTGHGADWTQCSGTTVAYPLG